MAGYLRKYVGRYRVKADYDLDTNDYPRLETGGLDPSFDDLYIDCQSNIKIRHGVGNILSCYVPSRMKGTNVLKRIYKMYSNNTRLPKETAPQQYKKYYENLCKQLVEECILVSAEVLDYEVYFEFKANMLDDIAELVGAKTYGSNINPMSSKNLPKAAYTISEEDMKLYKDAIKDLPTKEVEVKGSTRTMVDGFLIKKLNKEFDDIILKSKRKGFNIEQDRKSKGLKGKEYIHSLGNDMWNKYCDYLKTFANSKD